MTHFSLVTGWFRASSLSLFPSQLTDWLLPSISVYHLPFVFAACSTSHSYNHSAPLGVLKFSFFNKKGSVLLFNFYINPTSLLTGYFRRKSCLRGKFWWWNSLQQAELVSWICWINKQTKIWLTYINQCDINSHKFLRLNIITGTVQGKSTGKFWLAKGL